MSKHLISKISAELPFFHATAKKNLPVHLQLFAEDIAQDCIVKCIEKIHLYNPSKGSLRGWAYRIIRNECIDRIKAFNKHRTTQIEDFRTQESSMNEETGFSDPDQIKKAYKALTYLCERDRDLILHKFIHDLSGREISELMGIPEPQVPVYVQRAKRRLSQAFKKIAA